RPASSRAWSRPLNTPPARTHMRLTVPTPGKEVIFHIEICAFLVCNLTDGSQPRGISPLVEHAFHYRTRSKPSLQPVRLDVPPLLGRSHSSRAFSEWGTGCCAGSGAHAAPLRRSRRRAGRHDACRRWLRTRRHRRFPRAELLLSSAWSYHQ